MGGHASSAPCVESKICKRSMSGTMLKVFTFLVTSATNVTAVEKHSRAKMLCAFMWLKCTNIRNCDHPVFQVHVSQMHRYEKLRCMIITNTLFNSLCPCYQEQIDDHLFRICGHFHWFVSVWGRLEKTWRSFCQMVVLFTHCRRTGSSHNIWNSRPTWWKKGVWPVHGEVDASGWEALLQVHPVRKAKFAKDSCLEPYWKCSLPWSLQLQLWPLRENI